MEKFSYTHPITVRYGDLDPQGHVNNAVYLTYIESARLGYYEATGIWQSDSGLLTGMVVAHNDIDYVASITLGMAIRVGIRLVRIGHKSLTLAFSVMVAYDSIEKKSISFPPAWREKIHLFEDQNG